MSVEERSDDELLSTAGVPRWLTLLVAAVVVAVLGGVVAVKLSSSTTGHPSAASSSVPSPTSPSPPQREVPAALPADVLPLRLPYAVAPHAVVADGSRLYAIDNGTVVVRDGATTSSSPLGGIAPASAALARLALDAPRHVLWVVAPGGPGALVRVIDSATLVPGITIAWPRAIVAFAAVGGALYVIDRTGLYRLTTDGARRIPLPRGQAYRIAADPARLRVLVLMRSGYRTTVSAVRPGTATLTRPTPVDVATGSLAVTALGQIWLGGRGALGSFLVRLDPGDLRLIGNSVLGEQFGTASEVLAAGHDSLLIGAGPAVGRVWCVNGRDGAVTQYWDVAPSPATITHGSAYGVLASGLVRLQFIPEGCTG